MVFKKTFGMIISVSILIKGTTEFFKLIHYIISRTSVSLPVIAAAAAIPGDIKCVRPPRPWRPSKLRFDVAAQRSPGASWSGFIAKHIEHPASRHSKPASLKISAKPSSSACARTKPDPGTTIARMNFGRRAQIFNPPIRA